MKIAPLYNHVDNTLSEVKTILNKYQSGEKVLNLNDREKLKIQ